MILSNQELVQVTRMPYSKVRRWAKDFLPPDPRATKQSGYSRECTIKDGFYIHLLGHLISNLKFSAPEAKQVVDDVKEWLVAKELFPGENEERWSMRSVPAESRKFEIIIKRVMDQKYAIIPLEFVYLGITRLEKRRIGEGDPPTYQEIFREENILKTEKSVDSTNHIVLEIGELKEIFLAGIHSIKRDTPRRKGGKKKPKAKKFFWK